MNAIIVFLLLDTGLQLFACKFSLWFLMQLVSRALFCMRIIGATFKVRHLATAEIVAFICKIVFNFLFKGSKGFPWLNVLLFMLFTAVSIFLMLLDDMLYVYVIEDADDYD